jgi:hypothetical protein
METAIIAGIFTIAGVVVGSVLAVVTKRFADRRAEQALTQELFVQIVKARVGAHSPAAQVVCRAFQLLVICRLRSVQVRSLASRSELVTRGSVLAPACRRGTRGCRQYLDPGDASGLSSDHCGGSPENCARQRKGEMRDEG